MLEFKVNRIKTAIVKRELTRDFKVVCSYFSRRGCDLLVIGNMDEAVYSILGNLFPCHCLSIICQLLLHMRVIQINYLLAPCCTVN